jgi:hypothetical protein
MCGRIFHRCGGKDTNPARQRGPRDRAIERGTPLSVLPPSLDADESRGEMSGRLAARSSKKFASNKLFEQKLPSRICSEGKLTRSWQDGRNGAYRSVSFCRVPEGSRISSEKRYPVQWEEGWAQHDAWKQLQRAAQAYKFRALLAVADG